ncbi:MAG: PASTA domain-containing protein [Bacteroidales bacterium]|nr:PASTA domain-containing protein [Bacteroidales bacterium]
MKNYKILEYLKSRYFLKNLGFAALITLLVLVLILISIRIYTHHGEAFSVPDFTGLTVPEVEELVKKRDLRFEVFDSVYLNNFDRGTVVEQYPVPGFKVKKNRTIFLKLNAIAPERVVMPNLVGHTFRQARTIMEASGLTVGQLEYIYDIGKNVVLEQKYMGVPVSKGDTLVKGASINLVLGKGLGTDKTSVPKLVLLTLEEAKIKASDKYLRIGATLYDETDMGNSDTIVARIWKQEPGFEDNILLPLGSSIDIWLTTDSTKFEIAHDSIDEDINDVFEDI